METDLSLNIYQEEPGQGDQEPAGGRVRRDPPAGPGEGGEAEGAGGAGEEGGGGEGDVEAGGAGEEGQHCPDEDRVRQ